MLKNIFHLWIRFLENIAKMQVIAEVKGPVQETEMN